MKNLIYSFLLISLVACNSDEEKTNFFIQNFFDTHFQFASVDSIKGKVPIKILHNQINMETMNVELVIPDSIQYSDFYNAYSNRIIQSYYKSIDLDKRKSLDSLLIAGNCDADEFKKMIIEHYSNDKVFVDVFKTALSSFYGNKVNATENVDFTATKKVEVQIDTLIQIALIQIDILGYDTIKGFFGHFVCGVNPYSYSTENKVNLLIPGFCQEALRNKEMINAYSQTMKLLGEKLKPENEYDKEAVQQLCRRFQYELRRMLLKEGTLKKSLLEYYEKRKDIEPFKIVDNKVEISAIP